ATPAPDANDEYLLYQTMLGAWPHAGDYFEPESPSFCERLQQYLIKAVREAKRHSSWTDPNTEYERAASQFIERLLDRASSSKFLQDFESFQQCVAFFGQFNSLSQILLKLTCPGVPDLYQGTELWDLSLVDPDNRRPVDFAY